MFPTKRSHPWHGVNARPSSEALVTAYIEIVPSDTIKYELDKESGLLKVDRPQKYSNRCPALYGFVPQTYCGAKIAKRCEAAAKRNGIEGDGDPLDILVLCEQIVPRGDILVQAVPIGGLRMIDANQADDKIISVLKDDALYSTWKDIAECPPMVLDRLRHYFLTYKELPGDSKRRVEIAETYGADEAQQVIELAREDYRMLGQGQS
jgi:inorganic pyrophosphatase